MARGVPGRTGSPGTGPTVDVSGELTVVIGVEWTGSNGVVDPRLSPSGASRSPGTAEGSPSGGSVRTRRPSRIWSGVIPWMTLSNGQSEIACQLLQSMGLKQPWGCLVGFGVATLTLAARFLLTSDFQLLCWLLVRGFDDRAT